MVWTSVLLLLSAQPDTPLRLAARAGLAPTRPPSSARVASAALPLPLDEARRLSQQLRYEEAMVEYQRYLGLPDRPAGERAQALLELGFLHLVLGDEVTAHARSAEALALAPALELPPSASAKLRAFLDQSRQRAAARTQLEFSPRKSGAPAEVCAQLVDPSHRVKRVQLRHALAATGPYFASPMSCVDQQCCGQIPPPIGARDFTLWYFAEALDGAGNTVAQAGTATEPRQLAVLGASGWYERPWVWAAGGATVIAAAGVVYLLAPPLPASGTR